MSLIYFVLVSLLCPHCHFNGGKMHVRVQATISNQKYGGHLKCLFSNRDHIIFMTESYQIKPEPGKSKEYGHEIDTREQIITSHHLSQNSSNTSLTGALPALKHSVLFHQLSFPHLSLVPRAIPAGVSQLTMTFQEPMVIAPSQTILFPVKCLCFFTMRECYN